MPTISIFIRKDDLPKWKDLDNKSEWLHNKLSSNFDIVNESLVKPLLKENHRLGKAIDKEIRNLTCRHGSDPKFCKFSKPGKPCK